MLKRIIALAILLLTVFSFGCSPDTTQVPEENSGISLKDVPKEVRVPVLMFHDVKIREGGDWSISTEGFKRIITTAVENGFTPISFDTLMEYADGNGAIPEKPICITFDDGYYSNYNRLLPLITEMNVPVTVFMTCSSVRDSDVPPSDDETILCKMSAEELKIMEESPLVRVQSHTYALHGKNTSYSQTERRSTLPLEEESKEEYSKIFNADCELAEQVLQNVGVNRVDIFSYPNGLHHEWTEEILKERNYKISITTNYDAQNIVKRGHPETLFLLGRMNINDATTTEKLLKYLNRTVE